MIAISHVKAQKRLVKEPRENTKKEKEREKLKKS